MQTSIMRSVSAVALTMVLAAGASAAPLDPAVACGFAKMHAALKASSALNACFRHAIQTGSDPDPACVDAAHARLSTTFANPGSGFPNGMNSGSSTATSVFASINPRTTAGVTLASCASALTDRANPSPATVTTRSRDGVIFAGRASPNT